MLDHQVKVLASRPPLNITDKEVLSIKWEQYSLAAENVLLSTMDSTAVAGFAATHGKKTARKTTRALLSTYNQNCRARVF